MDKGDGVVHYDTYDALGELGTSRALLKLAQDQMLDRRLLDGRHS